MKYITISSVAPDNNSLVQADYVFKLWDGGFEIVKSRFLSTFWFEPNGSYTGFAERIMQISFSLINSLYPKARRYELNEKPQFKNGQKVRFSIIGNDIDRAEGEIVGYAGLRGQTEIWVVKIDKSIDSKLKNHQFDTILVEHSLFYVE